MRQVPSKGSHRVRFRVPCWGSFLGSFVVPSKVPVWLLEGYKTVWRHGGFRVYGCIVLRDAHSGAWSLGRFVQFGI